MCGIAGLISHKHELTDVLERAQRIQAHRGPDSSGMRQFAAGNWHIGLAFQRLAILDLSEAGNQPMASYDGTSWLVYNGEVYNYKEIRTELEAAGIGFTSTSDSEVVLAALRHWGPEQALTRFNGMWGFAWLDLAGQRLVLARDRAGVKPLYYAAVGGEFYFASELKTILAMSGAKYSVNPQTTGEYLVQSMLETSADSFLNGISKVPQGTYCELDLTVPGLAPVFKPYWQVPYVESAVSGNNAAEEIRELFFDAVRLRLRSDVPLGILLSGGIDSSSIAAAMRAILGTGHDLNMLSAVSNDQRFDESIHIDRMSRHLDCPVHKVNLDFHLDAAFDLLARVCWHNDEPVGSFSNVAQYLLMQRAREHGITVILSGQGADELLCGYLKFLGFYLQQLVRSGHPVEAAALLGQYVRRGTVVSQFAVSDAKRYLPGFLRPPEADIRGCALADYQPVFAGLAPGMTLQERQALDVKRFSVPILTHYEDRMSMAHSREIRVPFLDYRLIERLVTLPARSKLNDGWTKYIFRKGMAPYLPPEIIWRKDKQGFINPEGEWLKRELQPEIMEVFLDPESLIYRKQLVNQTALVQKYRAYCRQPAGCGAIAAKDVFNPLALEIWLRQFEASIAG